MFALSFNVRAENTKYSLDDLKTIYFVNFNPLEHRPVSVLGTSEILDKRELLP